jgi:hypothetical protein
VPKTDVEHTKGNDGSYSNLYPFGHLAQGSFYVHQIKKFLESLPNLESTMN